MECHSTLEHTSWLNSAEIEIATLATPCLNRRIASKDVLERHVTAWQDARNWQQSKVVWHVRIEDTPITLPRLSPRPTGPETALSAAFTLFTGKDH